MRAVDRLTRSLPALAVAVALALTATSTATAVVRFEPSVPQAWDANVPVAVDWADVSMRVPESWNASPKSEPATGLGSAASLMVAAGPGDSLCLLHYYLADQIETWQDVGVQPTTKLVIDGHRAERFDDMLGVGAPISSAYSIYHGEHLYSLLCHADQAPVDRWLSIAQTLELPD